MKYFFQIIGNFINETSYERTGEYKTESEITPITAIIVSIYCIGGMIGGSCTGLLSEK